jgi:hypothetical protein
MNYESWLAEVPDSLKRDPVWKFVAYPKSLWLFDLVWVDCEKLKSNQQGRALINQLIRSTDSISVNIDEGYGRGLSIRNMPIICGWLWVLRGKLAVDILRFVSRFPMMWFSIVLVYATNYRLTCKRYQ